MLGEISSEEDEEGRGLLTVVVVHKAGDMKPGSGFFTLARSRGRDIGDRQKIWVEELERVYEIWSEMTGAPVGSAEGSQAFGENLGVNMAVTGALRKV